MIIKYKKYKLVSYFVLIVMMVSFFVIFIIVFVVIVNYIRIVDYVFIWYLVNFVGFYWIDDGVYMIKVEGEFVFCIEYGIILNGGFGFDLLEFIIVEKDCLFLIVYYGYKMNFISENYGII